MIRVNVPRRHIPSIAYLKQEEKEDLAKMLGAVGRRFDNLYVFRSRSTRSVLQLTVVIVHSSCALFLLITRISPPTD